MKASYDLDIDGDGRSDLLFKSQNVADPYVVWLQGDYHSPLVLAPFPNVADVRFGDLNGDGRSDLIFRTNDGAVVAWMGGDPGAAVNIGKVSMDWTLRTGDLKGDGKTDLIFWDKVTGNVVSWNDGDLTKADVLGNVSQTGDAPGRQLLVGDFDGDHKDDLYFWISGYIAGADNPSNGRGAFWSSGQPSQSHYVGTASYHLTPTDVMDINGDGVDDIVAHDDAGDSLVWLGGSPANRTSYFGTLNGAYRFADLNGDGKTDVLVSGGMVPDTKAIYLLNSDFAHAGVIGAVDFSQYAWFG